MSITKHYVVDSSIALYGALPAEFFVESQHEKARAASAFLSRAAFHGAELHVPVVFFSEIMNLVYQEFIQTKILSLEEGQILLETIFSTTWEFHFPIFQSVFELQHRIAPRAKTIDAEFLSLAKNFRYPFITTDATLLLDVQSKIREVEIYLVTEHPWAKSGRLEDFPPTD
jgi:predicted nucleic acid-binding protein